MPTTITTNTAALISNAEVSFGTIVGGPFDFIDTYVSVGAHGVAEWRLYGTVAGVQSLLASAPGGGLAPAILSWDVGGSAALSPQSPAQAAATTYELRAFWPADQGAPPAAVTASLVGYNEFDVAPDAVAGGAPVVVPASGAEVIVGTIAAGNWSHVADVSVVQSLALPVRFTLYAQASGAGIFTPVKSAVTTGDLEVPISRIFSKTPLPGATSYQLRASLALELLGNQPAAAVAVTATLATHSPVITAGGTVALKWIVTSTTNANVNVATQLNPKGFLYEGLNGLTANRTVFVNTTATGEIGDETIVKDEDGSLALWNIVIDPGAGNTIDGAATYTMTLAQNGLRGSVSLVRISATAWALV